MITLTGFDLPSFHYLANLFAQKSDHFVSAVLCFVPDGTIATGFYNVPGCCHGSTIADWGGIYDKQEMVYEETGLNLSLLLLLQVGFMNSLSSHYNTT